MCGDFLVGLRFNGVGGVFVERWRGGTYLVLLGRNFRARRIKKTFFLFFGLPEIPVTDVSFDDFADYPSTIFLDG